MAWVGTPLQVARWKQRLLRPWYYVEFLLHAGLGALAGWFPPLWAFILYRELAQAATGDGKRPSQSTGWLDPLTDLTAYTLGACLTRYLF